MLKKNTKSVTLKPSSLLGCWDIEWLSLEEIVFGDVCMVEETTGQPWDGLNPGTFDAGALSCRTTYNQKSADYQLLSGKVQVLQNSNMRSARPVWENFKDNDQANAIFVGKTRRQGNLYIARAGTQPRCSVGRYENLNKDVMEFQDWATRSSNIAKKAFQILLCHDI